MASKQVTDRLKSSRTVIAAAEANANEIAAEATYGPGGLRKLAIAEAVPTDAQAILTKAREVLSARQRALMSPEAREDHEGERRLKLRWLQDALTLRI